MTSPNTAPTTIPAIAPAASGFGLTIGVELTDENAVVVELAVAEMVWNTVLNVVDVVVVMGPLVEGGGGPVFTLEEARFPLTNTTKTAA